MSKLLAPPYSPLILAPSPSWQLGLGLKLAYTLALLITATLPVSLVMRLILGSVLLARAFLDLDLHIWRKYFPWAIQEATWDQQGIWILSLADGTKHPAELADNSLVTSRLVVLNFRLPYAWWQWWQWWQYSLVLTTDNCNTEILRRLRVRLKLENNATLKISDAPI